jgi:hypothetical protein
MQPRVETADRRGTHRCRGRGGPGAPRGAGTGRHPVRAHGLRLTPAPGGSSCAGSLADPCPAAFTLGQKGRAIAAEESRSQHKGEGLGTATTAPATAPVDPSPTIGHKEWYRQLLVSGCYPSPYPSSVPHTLYPRRAALSSVTVLDPAVAPAGVLLGQSQEQLLDRGRDGRAAAGIVAPGGPLGAHQLAVPLEDCAGPAEQDGVLQPRPRAGGQARQLGGESREGELLPAGEPRRRAGALQQAHLLLQEEDLEVLVVVGTPPGSDQVDEKRHEVREHQPAHANPPSTPDHRPAARPAARTAIKASGEGRWSSRLGGQRSAGG